MKYGLFLFLLTTTTLSSRGQNDLKASNNFTFYYVDNSEGYDADALNTDMIEHLKENLKRLPIRPDNYFFFYGCNGDEPKTSNNLTAFLDAPSFKKFLSKAAKESEYPFDKGEIRDFFTDNPVKIKQNAEVNIYLSSNAVKRIIDHGDELPTPVTVANELCIYLNSKEVKEKVYIYINKEAKEKYGEEKIKSCFMFCSIELGLLKVQPVIEFL